MNPFKQGDIVVLNSGSPPLTVSKIDGDQTAVVWVDDEGKPQGSWLPYVCLRSVASK